jgi:hypothetical protein
VWLKAEKERRSHKRFIAFIWFLNALLFNEKSFFYDPQKPCIICWSRNVTQTQQQQLKKKIIKKWSEHERTIIYCILLVLQLLTWCFWIACSSSASSSSTSVVDEKFRVQFCRRYLLSNKTQHHQCTLSCSISIQGFLTNSRQYRKMRFSRFSFPDSLNHCLLQIFAWYHVHLNV